MTEKRGFFDNLRHQLGGSPAPDDIIKAKDDKKSDANNDPKDSTKDPAKDTPKDTKKDSPKDSSKDTKAKKPKRLDDEDDRLDLDLLKSLLDATDAADASDASDATDTSDISDDSDDDADATDSSNKSGDKSDDNKPEVNRPDETMSAGVGSIGATIIPLNPVFKNQEGKRNMKMRDRDFYDRIGDLAYYHDRGDSGDYSELDTYIREYKTEALSEVDIIKEIDACLEADFARFSAVLLDRIANAEANRPDPVKRLFINKIDKHDTTEYETFEQAAESVKDNPYVTDPKAVFEQVWRQVNPDGTLGARVSEQEIRKYADTLNNKNKGAFLTRMGITEQKPQNQGNNRPNNQGGKKGDKPGKPNKSSDNSSNASNGAGN